MGAFPPGLSRLSFNQAAPSPPSPGQLEESTDVYSLVGFHPFALSRLHWLLKQTCTGTGHVQMTCDDGGGGDEEQWGASLSVVVRLH